MFEKSSREVSCQVKVSCQGLLILQMREMNLYAYNPWDNINLYNIGGGMLRKYFAPFILTIVIIKIIRKHQDKYNNENNG